MADETPQEREAEEKLDEATREVAWDEFDKSKVTATVGIPTLSIPGGRWWSWRWPLLGRRDPDPTDERGLRDVLREAEHEK